MGWSGKKKQRRQTRIGTSDAKEKYRSIVSSIRKSGTTSGEKSGRRSSEKGHREMSDRVFDHARRSRERKQTERVCEGSSREDRNEVPKRILSRIETAQRTREDEPAKPR
jgi:hypothetical protein